MKPAFFPLLRKLVSRKKTHLFEPPSARYRRIRLGGPESQQDDTRRLTHKRISKTFAVWREGYPLYGHESVVEQYLLVLNSVLPIPPRLGLLLLRNRQAC